VCESPGVLPCSTGWHPLRVSPLPVAQYRGNTQFSSVPFQQIYEGVTLRLAPNDEESHGATFTFNTGVAQGSITSPQLFNILIYALLRMLTVTGQNEDISHGLQIGKDQKGDNQRDENGYHFNNIGFIDDISIFADTPEGMQRLLNVV